MQVLHLMPERGRCFQADNIRRMGASLVRYLGPRDACSKRRFHGTGHWGRQDLQAAMEIGKQVGLQAPNRMPNFLLEMFYM